MNVFVLQTTSETGKHPTLFVHAAGSTISVTPHWFERPFWFCEGGIVLFGIGFFSFNVYTKKAFQ